MTTNAAMKVGASSGSRASAGCMVLAVALLAAGTGVQAQEGDAKAILRAMSDYVSSQKAI